MNSYHKIIDEGLWKNNVGFVQLLGLCPILAVTSTVINGLGMGIATTLILMASNATISAIRHLVSPEIRLPVFVLVIASFVTAIEMLIKAFYYDLYLILGIYIPLIVTNCSLVGRAEAFASKHPIHLALLDGVMMGIGFTFALIMLSGFRELVGYGTLLSQAHLLFGHAAEGMTFTLFEHYRGFLLAILPPGAFFGLGLLIALKNIIDNRAEQKIQTKKVIRSDRIHQMT